MLGSLAGAAATERTTGRPTSSNGASSLHLWWRWPGSSPDLVRVAVTLEVLRRPSVAELHFWALQVSFAEADGRVRHGAGHVGLQHHPQYPGGTAVNWGGYGPDGRELDGTDSALPSTLGNRNTRDLRWEAGRPVRIEVTRSAAGWAASVDGVHVRDLLAGGDRLVDVGMWSEVFAPCDAPSSAVRWSDPEGTTADGRTVHPVAVVTAYQEVRAGGCSNTVSEPDGMGVVQRTNVPRTIGAGHVLPLRSPTT